MQSCFTRFAERIRGEGGGGGVSNTTFEGRKVPKEHQKLGISTSQNPNDGDC